MAVIFYFSGTGNSLYTAQNIASQLKNCRIEGIAGYLKKPYPVKDQMIGIITPVYCMGLPPVVEKFIKALDAQQEYTFAVATCGAHSGQTLGQIKEILDQRGMRLNYAAQLFLPDNSIVFPTPLAKQGKMLHEANRDLLLIARNAFNKYDNYEHISRSPLWKHGGTAIGWWVLDNIKKIVTYTCDDKKCVGCGQCAFLCPADNITMVDDRPQFGDACEHCFGCAHWCPATAISVGKMLPNEKTRYTHPKIKAEDIAAQKEERKDAHEKL